MVIEQAQAPPSLFRSEEGRDRAQMNSLRGANEQLIPMAIGVSGLSAVGSAEIIYRCNYLPLAHRCHFALGSSRTTSRIRGLLASRADSGAALQPSVSQWA